jgi:hypothetical protein
MLITELVDRAVLNASNQMLEGKLELHAIIFQAVQAGMADAYDRGIELGKTIAAKTPA